MGESDHSSNITHSGQGDSWIFTMSIKSPEHSANQAFRFEEDFMEDGLRCIPMAVRFKLDACGIKLKLSEWNKLTRLERARLDVFPWNANGRIFEFRKYLVQLVLSYTGNEPTRQPIDRNPAWSVKHELPVTLQEEVRKHNWSISLRQWEYLSNLERFVLLKLSRPGHENRNFARAMNEFGLTGSADLPNH